jgi:hypothetical protein
VTRADNSHHLARAAAARHERSVALARAAIDALDRRGVPFTFSAVAAAAGVSRGWLYNQPELRDAITRLRAVAGSATTAPVVPASQRATPESLRQRLDDARETIGRLRAENAMLRDHLARRLGEERMHH